MRAPAWPLLFALALLAGFAADGGTPAHAGDLLPIIACDSLAATGPTTFDFVIWTHGMAEFCRTELRPHASVYAPAEPILAWTMPEGWTRERGRKWVFEKGVAAGRSFCRLVP